MQLILVINCRTRIEYYANRFSTLIPIKPLGLIVHGLCFLGVDVFAIEFISMAEASHVGGKDRDFDSRRGLKNCFAYMLLTK